ncbi:WAT1-related protein At2g37460-like [Mangifera indica]|uniref:WAT1-related protein At2g37460-like n=1 Tax=Mangifera indica TaxID=29780 RepID=UPI001CF979BA|nr:WAT1-related protein At2g37460-like [Mangifera indica]
MKSKLHNLFNRARPFIGVIFLQVGLAGMDVLSKAALNQGMSNYVLVVYRHAVATLVMTPFAAFLDKKIRPKMTLPIFTKLLLLGLLEPIIDQNLYYIGMKYTTATFAAAMYNILPAVTFLLAWVVRLERVNIKSIRSQAKIVGTAATVGGAMVMTLLKGPILDLFWTKAANQDKGSGGIAIHNLIKGALLITVGCFSWACFMILQAITLKTYPAELSLTAWICFLGTVEGSIVALVMERGKSSIWAIHWDTKLVAVLYSGIVCSGLAYYIQGIIMKDRGPVFVSAFSPLCMVIVAIVSSIVLAEQMYLGRVIGAIIVVAGLYLVVWGKSKDYASSSTSIDEKIPSAAEQVAADSNIEESSDHEAIIIDMCDQEIVTRK